MRTKIINAKIYDTAKRTFYEGSVTMEDGVILSTGPAPHPCGQVIDAKGYLLIPGLVDVHTHGRAGGDFATADVETLKGMLRSYFNAGVTTVMPTLASDTIENWLAAIARIKSIKASKDRARCIGLHLEGRWLNPKKRGVHAVEFLTPPNVRELVKIAKAAGNPLHITAALELDKSGAFLQKAKELKATVALGHTCATNAQAVKAVESGVCAFTHLFNAMEPLHHRSGGAACAALTTNAFCELICDGKHVAAEMVRLAYQLKGPDRLVLISDSMAGTACSDGIYNIAGTKVTLNNGEARTQEGNLAGSTLSLYDAVLNLTKFCSIPFTEAIYCATAAPAKMAGIFDQVGSIEPGKAAAFVLVNPDNHTIYQTLNFI